MPPFKNKSKRSYQKYKKSKVPRNSITSRFQRQFVKTKLATSLIYTFTWDNGSPNVAAVDFQLTTILNDFAQASTYEAMYDRYRIMAVKWELFPCWNTSEIVGTLGTPAPGLPPNIGAVSVPLLTYAVDKTLTVGGTPLTFTAVTQRSNSKQRYFDKPFKVYYKTKLQAIETPVGGGNDYVAARSNKQWLECTTDGLSNQYAGVHCAMRCNRSVASPVINPGDTVSVPFVFDIIQTAYVEFMRTV